MHDGSVDRSAALGRRHTIRGRWHVVRLWRRTGCHVRCLMRCGKRSIVDRSSMWLHVLDIHHVWHVSGGRCVVVWHRGRHALGRPDRATRYVEGVPRWHTAAVHIAWRHAWRSILYMHRMLRGQWWAATHHMSAINARRLSASQSRASQHKDARTWQLSPVRPHGLHVTCSRSGGVRVAASMRTGRPVIRPLTRR